jgi:glycosyltransferase involved in cell wall biosynthesis
LTFTIILEKGKHVLNITIINTSIPKEKLCIIFPRAFYLFNPNARNKNDKVCGAQKQSFILSTELAKDPTFDIHFCVADFGQDNFEVRMNVKLWKVFNFNELLIKRTFRFLKTLKKINADYYIFRSPDLGVAIAVFYIKYALKKKIIYMIAGDMETSDKRLSKFTNRRTAFFMKYVYNKADKITAQTFQQADQFKKFRKRAPDRVLRNIYPKIYPKIDISKKNEILWVGRLDKIKKPELFLELAKKYSHQRFVMIAPVVRDHQSYGTQFQEKTQHIENLILLNYIDPIEIKTYYSNAKLYVLTSEFEGFSNTMAEACQHECPTLSYNVNPDNILHHHNFGICAEGNRIKFFAEFELLINNKDKLIEMGKNARDYIETYHSVEENFIQFKSIFDR